MDWIYLAEDRNQRRALLNMVKNLHKQLSNCYFLNKAYASQIQLQVFELSICVRTNLVKYLLLNLNVSYATDIKIFVTSYATRK
jgi:hypothetical protein